MTSVGGDRPRVLVAGLCQQADVRRLLETETLACARGFNDAVAQGRLALYAAILRRAEPCLNGVTIRQPARYCEPF